MFNITKTISTEDKTVSQILSVLDSTKQYKLIVSSNITKDYAIRLFADSTINKTVTNLHFQWMKISNDVAVETRKFLETNQALEHLCIEECEMDEPAMSELVDGIVNVLESSTNFHSLKLNGCNIQTHKLKQLLSSLERNNSLELLDLEFIGLDDVVEDIASVLQNNTSLTSFGMQGSLSNLQSIENICKSLEQNSTLQELYVWNMKMSRELKSELVNRIHEFLRNNHSLVEIDRVIKTDKMKEIIKRNRETQKNIRFVKTKSVCATE